MAKIYDTSVELCGVKLDNPVIPASGTFGFGKEHNEFYDINILGSISIKGTTREARFGNPTPRIAECRSGMINSVGLQNPGVDAVVSHELPELRKIFRTVLKHDSFVMANVFSLKRMGTYSFFIAALCLVRFFLYQTIAMAVLILVFVIAGLFSKVLAFVFEQAITYKEENDLTI